jgi:hypothetical protein
LKSLLVESNELSRIFNQSQLTAKTDAARDNAADLLTYSAMKFVNS